MACLHPLRAFATGAFSDKGRPIYFVTSARFPYATCDDFKKRGLAWKNTYVDEFIEIPCGHCVGCKKDKQRAWAFRCVAEAQKHLFNYFLTLTYDDSNNPGVLVKKDLQLFNKRLRNNFGDFRFFACGEYGDQTARPHFHELIFCDRDFFQDKVLWSKKGAYSLYNSVSLDGVWSKGFAVIGTMTVSAASYCAKYCLKGGDNGFILMSRRPGLGDSFFNEEFEAKSTGVLVLPTGEGSSIHAGFPRYFKDKKGIANPFTDCLDLKLFNQVKFSGCSDVDSFRDLCDYIEKNPLVR